MSVHTSSMQMQHSMSWLARWLDMRRWRARHSAACSLRCCASEGCIAKRWQFCSAAINNKLPMKHEYPHKHWKSSEHAPDTPPLACCGVEPGVMRHQALTGLAELLYISADCVHTHVFFRSTDARACVIHLPDNLDLHNVMGRHWKIGQDQHLAIDAMQALTRGALAAGALSAVLRAQVSLRLHWRTAPRQIAPSGCGRPCGGIQPACEEHAQHVLACQACMVKLRGVLLPVNAWKRAGTVLCVHGCVLQEMFA